MGTNAWSRRPSGQPWLGDRPHPERSHRMHHHKFDPAHLDRLEDPERFLTLPPSVLWSAAAVATPRTIVDLGAGTGLYAAAFSAFAPSATILAVDIDDAMLDWLRTHRTEVAQGRVVPVKAEEA